jgi:thiamine-phosphate pyrophosphorylase
VIDLKITSKDLLLYAVTDRNCLRGISLEEAVEQAILGGVSIVQLREKNISEDELIAEAKKLMDICHKHGVPFIINDDYEAAIKCGADGVHVGIEDAPVAEIRRIAGDDFIIGATAKTVEQARLAESSGADYLGVGAVFPSPTKTNAVRITPQQLSEICGSVNIPAVAIGGITADNVHTIKGCGHKGAAVVSAVFGADDVKAAAEELRKAVLETL